MLESTPAKGASDDCPHSTELIAHSPVGDGSTPASDHLPVILASGGDGRISIDPVTGLNRYLTSTYPRENLAYASSTANDVSPDCFDHLLLQMKKPMRDYREKLEQFRRRVRKAFRTRDDTEIVFAPSGTDLEYVALASVVGKRSGGVLNILLGADEVGRGCRFAAAGKYYERRTALGINVEARSRIAGLEEVSFSSIPIREDSGEARSSEELIRELDRQMAGAIADDKQVLVHVLHGSKTGLIKPSLRAVRALVERWNDRLTLAVDACQARITNNEIAEYLALNAIVFLTGSKFVGGVPFTGVALVPVSVARSAAPMPSGYAKIFRRAEWPDSWLGADILDDDENLGLAMRIEGTLFEIERFKAIPPVKVAAVVDAFGHSLDKYLVKPLGVAEIARDVESQLGSQEQQSLRNTLATIDLSSIDAVCTHADAVVIHHKLAMDGIRLGQPVECRKLSDGTWAGTLRFGLSMPQIVGFSKMNLKACQEILRSDMQAIRAAIATKS